MSTFHSSFIPLPVAQDRPKLVRESAYLEQTLSEFLGAYALRAGMSKSHALRRLLILGALSEGHVFDGSTVTDTNAEQAA